MKFVLLHEGKNDDGIRQFFMDVWELYVKVRGFRRGFEAILIMGADDGKSLSYSTYSDEECSI
jgi:hypothetical protein